MTRIIAWISHWRRGRMVKRPVSQWTPLQQNLVRLHIHKPWSALS